MGDLIRYANDLQYAVQLGKRAYDYYRFGEQAYKMLKGNKSTKSSSMYGGTKRRKYVRAGKAGSSAVVKWNASSRNARRLPKKRPKKKKTRSLKKRVYSLEKKVADNIAIKKCKIRSYGQINNAVNQCNHSTLNILNHLTVETQLDDLRYYSLSGVQAEVDVDMTGAPATGTWQNVKIANPYWKFTARNNNLVPVDGKMYIIKCISPTSSTPLALAATEDSTVGLASNWYNDIQSYYTDFRLPKNKFKLLKTESFRLAPGDEITKSFAMKDFKWSPVANDLADNTYQKSDYVCMIRCQGVLAHDDADTDALGHAPAGFDYFYEVSFDVRYPSTLNYRYMEHANVFADPMAGGAVVVEPDVEENKDNQ